MRNVSDKNQNTHFEFNIFFLKNPAFYEIIWKNMAQPEGVTDYNTVHAHSMLDN